MIPYLYKKKHLTTKKRKKRPSRWARISSPRRFIWTQHNARWHGKSSSVAYYACAASLLRPTRENEKVSQATFELEPKGYEMNPSHIHIRSIIHDLPMIQSHSRVKSSIVHEQDGAGTRHGSVPSTPFRLGLNAHTKECF